MLPPASLYEKLLYESEVRPRDPPAACDMFSSVTGTKLRADKCTARYWKENMTSTVQFAEAVTQCILADPAKAVMVEIGPHPALKGPVTETLKCAGRTNIEYFHSCFRGKNDFISLLESTGKLIATGVCVSEAVINAIPVAGTSEPQQYDYGKVLTDLPSYRWNHSAGFWVESQISRRIRFRQFPRHQLLGSRVIDDTPSFLMWRNHWRLKEIPWLMELKVCILIEDNVVANI